nr:Cobalt import ATP-binding protein CbiO [Klebsiella pneumoniae]
MLATTDLWFRYQDEPVLKGLTLDFSRHAVTGLVGPTAAESRRCL